MEYSINELWYDYAKQFTLKVEYGVRDDEHKTVNWTTRLFINKAEQESVDSSFIIYEKPQFVRITVDSPDPTECAFDSWWYCPEFNCFFNKCGYIATINDPSCFIDDEYNSAIEFNVANLNHD